MLFPELEITLLKQGYQQIVGIDEAGRGAWAGPVSVGFFSYFLGDKEISGINDSKKLSPKARLSIFPLLQTRGGVVMRDNQQIDKVGIGNAIVDCMEEIMSLYPGAYFLIDGQFAHKFEKQHQLIVKGDSKVYSIAAASILAKVSRDLFMDELHQKIPQYEFLNHKGYGTSSHLQNLKTFGPSAYHRFSYAPVRKLS